MMRNTTITPISIPSLASAPIETTHYHLPPAPGSPPAPPLVFLHGFDSNFLEFRRLAAELESRGVEAYFVDSLGWGFTAKPPPSPILRYGPDCKRKHLLAWKIAVVGDEPVVLAGASIGGAQAIDFALECPDEVAGIVLIDAQAYLDKKASPVLGIPGVGDLLGTIGAEVLRSRWLRKMAVGMSYFGEELRASEEVLKIGGLHTRTEGWLEANVAFIRGEGYCLSEKVAGVCVPSLIVYGVQDKILPSVENAKRFLKELGGEDMVSVLAVEDAGHSPHVEKAVEVADSVVEFVRSKRLAGWKVGGADGVMSQ